MQRQLLLLHVQPLHGEDVLLSGRDADNRVICVKHTGWKPFFLVRLEGGDNATEEDASAWICSANARLSPAFSDTKRRREAVITSATPVTLRQMIGFSDQPNRKLWRMRMRRVGDYCSKNFGILRDDEDMCREGDLLHHDWPIELVYTLDHGIRMQTWVTLDGCRPVHPSVGETTCSMEFTTHLCPRSVEIVDVPVPRSTCAALCMDEASTTLCCYALDVAAGADAKRVRVWPEPLAACRAEVQRMLDAYDPDVLMYYDDTHDRPEDVIPLHLSRTRKLDGPRWGPRPHGRSVVNLRGLVAKLPMASKITSFHLADVFEQLCGVPDDTLHLVVQLEQRLKLMLDVEAQAAAANMSIHVCASRGQKVMVWNTLLTHAHSCAMFVDPNALVRTPPVQVKRAVADSSFVSMPGFAVPTKELKGGFIFDPTPGVYEGIAVLDYASLYPSIMITFGVCFATLILDRKYLDETRYSIRFIPLDDYTCLPLMIGPIITAGDGTTRVEPCTTVLPTMLRRALSDRRTMQARAKAAVTDVDRALYTSKQAALKVFCNAIYGWLGVRENPQLQSHALMLAVTAIGRHMVRWADWHARTSRQCVTVYGDTDSVFVAMPPMEAGSDHAQWLDATYASMHALCAEITLHFRDMCAVVECKYAQIIFEKLFVNLHLTNKKKRYFALQFQPETGGWRKPPSIVVKGFDFQTRSRCRVVQDAGAEAVRRLLIGDALGAAQHVERCAMDMASGCTDRSRMMLSIVVRDIKEYKSRSMVQVTLAEQVRAKTGNYPPALTRLCYYLRRGPEKQFQRAMLVSNGAAGKDVDFDHLIDTQLLNGMRPLFSVTPRAEAIFADTLVRLNRFRNTNSREAGVMTTFFRAPPSGPT